MKPIQDKLGDIGAPVSLKHASAEAIVKLYTDHDLGDDDNNPNIAIRDAVLTYTRFQYASYVSGDVLTAPASWIGKLNVHLIGTGRCAYRVDDLITTPTLRFLVSEAIHRKSERNVTPHLANAYEMLAPVDTVKGLMQQEQAARQEIDERGEEALKDAHAKNKKLHRVTSKYERKVLDAAIRAEKTALTNVYKDKRAEVPLVRKRRMDDIKNLNNKEREALQIVYANTTKMTLKAYKIKPPPSTSKAGSAKHITLASAPPCFRIPVGAEPHIPAQDLINSIRFPWAAEIAVAGIDPDVIIPDIEDLMK
jgi:hypothetical protein